MRFDLTIAGIQSRRDRRPLLKARSEWGATAWKLTVSAPCTLTDKRSLRKKKEIHMFTITILRCIREKMLRTHKMADLQNAAAAGQTPQIILFSSLKLQNVTEGSIDILIKKIKTFECSLVV